MKRRDFIKTPALGILLPARTRLEELFATDPEIQARVPGGGTRGDVEQRLHSDYITFVPGIEYFYLGNGEIQGAVQYSPKDPRCSFFGFTLMDPEHFCRKWSTYLYHPERGLTNSRLIVLVDEQAPDARKTGGMYFGTTGYVITPENFSTIHWIFPDDVPMVHCQWTAGSCQVEEEFFVPQEGALLFRRARIRNHSGRTVRVQLTQLLYPNFGLFDRIFVDEAEKAAHARGLSEIRLAVVDRQASVAGRYDVRVDLGELPPGETRGCVFLYSLHQGESLLSRKSFDVLHRESVDHWRSRSSFETGCETLDHFFQVSRTCLRSVVARSGRMDAGTWMYNMEWLSDHLLAMEALLRSGNAELARTMLVNNLQNNIGPDGRTVESGRRFGFDYTELNQNGLLLYGVWAYVCWTGDLDTIRPFWEKIRICGDFPMGSTFRDPETGMVHNKREFWERSDTHGVKDGYELAYQFWVGYGWERGAELAERIGDSETARRWSEAARKIKASVLSDPRYRMIEEGHLIKRRTLDGQWQRYFIPPDRSRVPAGCPLAVNPKPEAEPDTVTVYPILFGWIDPRGELARNTLAWVERLWNQAEITGGGYPRYNIESDENPPTPWAIASMLVARAYAEGGNAEKAWRVLEWLSRIHGGLSGSWFEQYTQSITPPLPPVGVVGWIWYELIAFCVYHIAGFRPGLERLAIRPWLPPEVPGIHSRHTVRGATVELTVTRSMTGGRAMIDGRPLKLHDGGVELDYPPSGSRVKIDIAL